MIKWKNPKKILPKEREWPIGSWQASHRASKLVVVAVEQTLANWATSGFNSPIRVVEGFYSHKHKTWYLQGFSGNWDDRVKGWSSINKIKFDT